MVAELPEQGRPGEVARARDSGPHSGAPPPGSSRDPRGPRGPRIRPHRNAARAAHPLARHRPGGRHRAVRSGQRPQRLPAVRAGPRPAGSQSARFQAAFRTSRRGLTSARGDSCYGRPSMEQRAPSPGPSSAQPQPSSEPEPGAPLSSWQRFKRVLLGGPKDIEDPQLFHTLSLAAFLAWVGLGADGLSSSSYGPEEASKTLGDHQYLAVFLALATAITVFIISAAYTKIIEHFPFGGGGYIVTSRLIGPRAGVVSGAALLIDYVLTCTTSIAAGGEAIFSNFPHEWHVWKLPVELTAIAMLTILNLRGVKESIRVLLPVFLTFLLTHVILIGGSVGFHLGHTDEVVRSVSDGLSHDLGTMGFLALALLFLRAYSLGAGPRVMANRAQDSFLPHRFGALSDRLTMQNGVLLMGGASFLMLLYTRGSVDALVVMYAINVFVTFSLSQMGMIRYWRRAETQKRHPHWRRPLAIAVVCFVLCSFILVVNLFEKFAEAASLTVVVTGALVGLCMLIKRHHNGVYARLKRLDQILTALPVGSPGKPLELQKKKPTAVLLVGGFSGLGIHSLLTIMKLFPRYFANVVFMSVGVVDSATFHGIEEVDRVREQTEDALRKYVDLARGMGIPADYRMSMGTEAISESEQLAAEVAKEYERSMFFAGKLIFERERWWDRLLHNETAYQLQRRLQFAGLPMVVLPVRVLE